MVVKDFTFKIKSEEFTIKVKPCNTILSKTTGLMFRKNSPPLLFTFKKPTNQPIHSFFCLPFIAIWFLENKVTELRHIKPNQLSIKPKQKFTRLLEIPSNNKDFSFFHKSIDDSKV